MAQSDQFTRREAEALIGKLRYHFEALTTLGKLLARTVQTQNDFNFKANRRRLQKHS